MTREGFLGGVVRSIRLYVVVTLVGLLFVVGVPSASLAATVQDVVAQVSQAQYTSYLSNESFLYTHTGNNRGWGSQHDLARANIYNTLSSFGLSTTLEPFSYSGGTYYNVVSVMPGKITPNNIYIVGAHYDSVSNPGADDDASGVAGVLEIARVMSQYEFKSTMVFIAFDREEQGQVGSSAYAAAHQGDNICGMLALDEIAWNNPNNRDKAFVYSDYIDFRTAVASAISTYGNGLTVVQRANEYGTDNWYFRLYDKPNGFIEEDYYGGNPNYHKSTDSVDTPGFIDYAYATNMVRGLVGYYATAAEVVPEPATPGDLNDDGYVDAADLDLFRACDTGPSVPYDPQNLPADCTLVPVSGIISADMDRDGDVDQSDFGISQRCYRGPDNPADPNCAN